MPEDFDGLQGAPAGGDPGQSSDGGEQTPQDVVSRKDLDNLRSSLDRQIAEERREKQKYQKLLEESQRLARDAQEETAFLRSLAQQVPDMGDAVAARSAEFEANRRLREIEDRARAAEQQLTQYQQAEQVNQWKRAQEQAAREAGIDTSAPQFRDALERTLDTGDISHLTRTVAELARGAQPPAQPDTQRTTASSMPLPPQGGAPVTAASTEQALQADYLSEVKAAKARGSNAATIAEIRAKYRGKGLQKFPPL